MYCLTDSYVVTAWPDGFWLKGVKREKNDQIYVGWGLYVSCEDSSLTENSFSETPSPTISKLIDPKFCRQLAVPQVFRPEALN